MPIYEYRCSKCGEVFEVIQKFDDKPVTRCKHCKGSVERLLSNSSFQLKGSGWYLTDYAKKSEPAKPKSESGEKAAAKTDAGETTKSTKPEKTDK